MLSDWHLTRDSAPKPPQKFSLSKMLHSSKENKKEETKSVISCTCFVAPLFRYPRPLPLPQPFGLCGMCLWSNWYVALQHHSTTATTAPPSGSGNFAPKHTRHEILARPVINVCQCICVSVSLFSCICICSCHCNCICICGSGSACCCVCCKTFYSCIGCHLNVS